MIVSVLVVVYHELQPYLRNANLVLFVWRFIKKILILWFYD